MTFFQTNTILSNEVSIMNKNPTAKLIFRCIWVAIALVSTVCTFTDHVGFLGGDFRPATLFFTSWSAWISTLAAVLALISTLKKDEKTPQWIILVKFCAIIMMIATFVISAFVLPDKIWKASYWTFGSTFKHFLLPIITVADTIIYDEKDSHKAYHPFAALVVPLIYWAAVIIRFCAARGSNGGAIPANLWDNYYPYGFTNIDNGHSLFGLIRLLAIIMVALIAVGYAFYFAKKDYKKNK